MSYLICLLLVLITACLFLVWAMITNLIYLSDKTQDSIVPSLDASLDE